MKIIVVSDSHGREENLKKVIEMHRNADVFLHLGDGAPGFLSLCRTMGFAAFAVRGNCDFFSSHDSPLENQLLLNLDGIKIFMTHSHYYGGNHSSVEYAAFERGADIALFGHTHERYSSYIAPDDEYKRGALYVMNPGSIERPRDFLPPSYGIIDITKSGIMTNIVDVPGL